MSQIRVIVDTDILSMFAKADAVAVLEQIFGQENIAVTPAIRDEISVPLQYGYEFPERALSKVPVIPLTASAWQDYERLRTSGSSLGRGELEGIALCKTEGALFATNDLVARRFAQEQGVQVISLQAILRGLWVSGVVSKLEVRKLLDRIKRADRLEVSLQVEQEIFDEDGLAIS